MRKFINDRYNLTGRTYREKPIVIDPAANSFKLQLRRFHMKTKNAKNDVLFGIRVVSSLLKQGKLKFSRKCVKLLEEIHTYQWDSKKQMQGLDFPKKVSDHCMDAMRYVVLSQVDKSNITKAAINVGLY